VNPYAKCPVFRCATCNRGGLFAFQIEECARTDCPGVPVAKEPEGPAVRTVKRGHYTRHEYLQADGSYMLCAGPGKCGACDAETDRMLGKRTGGSRI
jgi:hypothetical protein